MNASWLVASSTSIGGRRRQEDRVVTVPDLNVHVPETSHLDRGIARSYFAVFDGHGGAGASSFLAKRFHLALAKNPLLPSDPKAALLDVWQSMDSEMFTFLAQKRRDNTARASINSGGRLPREEAPFPKDGSTATVVLLVGDKMFSANCGDSAGELRILVKKNGSIQAITKTHDTLDMDEFKRIKQLGGLYRNQKLQIPRKWPWCCVAQDVVVGKPRVCGLLVTRAFGDFSCKVDALGGTPGIIVPDCEEVLEMTIEEDWAEVVIASDGVWDVVPPRDMPKLLSRLEGKTTSYVSLRSMGIHGMNGSGRFLKDAPISINGRYMQGGDSSTSGSDRDSASDGEDTHRMIQAKLQGACAKLILTCVRDRYWAANLAAADNASAVIIRFRSPQAQSPSSGGTSSLTEDSTVV
ncbi:unnamed protein product [Scytosiphon promiscuus]